MSVGGLIENCFTSDLGVSHIAFVGTWFPSAPASADWRLRPYFLIGAKVLAVSVAFFLLASFGDGAVFSDVDDSESDDELDISLSNFRFGVVTGFVVFILNLFPLVGVRWELPPVRFPVGIAFRLIGLSCCFFRGYFVVRLVVPFRNMGCCGGFGDWISKKRKQSPFSERIYRRYSRWAKTAGMVRILKDKVRKHNRYFLVVLVVFLLFVPTLCVVLCQDFSNNSFVILFKYFWSFTFVAYL